MMRELIALVCEQCKRKNYTTTRNKKKTTEKLSLKKFCPPAGVTPCTRRAKV
jgi:large subunit ribosomal protein L33